MVDPAAQLRRTYEFIGLDPAVPEGLDVSGRVNESRGAKVVLSEWQEDQLARHYAPQNERLAAMLPDLDLSLWKGPR